MNKLALKIGTGTLAAAATLLVFAGSAFAADPSCTITGNGVYSKNKCVYVNKTTTKIVKVNKAFVGTVVVGVAATGGNSISGNTGGSSTVVSGDATVRTTIITVVNTEVSL